MDFKNLLDDILVIAKNVAPLIVPGAGPAIIAAEAAIRAIDKIVGSGELKPGEEAPAVEMRSVLEAQVTAHANRTADSLS